MNYYENTPQILKGHIQMFLYKDGKIINQYEDHNVIVQKASQFMAARMAPTTSEDCPRITAHATTDVDGVITSETSKDTSNTYPLNAGFQYLALGNGNLKNLSEAEKGQYLYNADISVTETQQKEQYQLQNETLRKPISSWAFVDDDYNISTEVTNILKLSTKIEYKDFDSTDSDNYFIVEMGLFGGDATTEKNSGYMFNYKLFKSWNMLKDSTLIVNWYITF